VSFRIIDGKNYLFSDEDLWILAEMETHPEVMKWNIDVYTDDTNKMYRLFKKAIKKLPKEKNQIFLIAKLNNKGIGFLGIRRGNKSKKHVGIVGITIHPDYWNRGFGTRLLKAGKEKAKKEGLLRLEAETMAKNKAMIRIAEKVGFKIEGTMEMRIKKNEKYEDEALLGMILR